MTWVKKGFTTGDWVEVLSLEEILATLDDNAALAEMPFMPEMAEYCGKRFKISGSAHKTCDTVHKTGGRRMLDSVHLAGSRCDGAAHDGCQANCLLFWKTAWLRPVDEAAEAENVLNKNASDEPVDRNALAMLQEATKQKRDDRTVYSCQATKLFDATSELRSSNLTQYISDVRSKNVKGSEALKVLFLAGIYNLRNIGIGYNLAVRLYGAVHKMILGRPAPMCSGTIPENEPTPSESLDLQVGELVEVKTQQEILQTLNTRGHNRGLDFDPEMTPYCGNRFRVAARIDRIIHETTGEMMTLKNPCIVLDGVFCQGQYSRLRLMCPRKIPPYWREIWLRRVQQ